MSSNAKSYISHLPASATSYLDTFSTCAPSTSSLTSSKARSKLRSSTKWAEDLDVVQVLGGEGEEGYGDGLGTYGHVGCVNALNWSSDGSLLASGSDDTRICLWKLGQEIDYVEPSNPVVEEYAPLGLGLAATVHTGHRANIFSVKFAPNSQSKLFSCAGDHEVRVFDLGQDSLQGQTFRTETDSSHSRTGSPYAREWVEYSKTSGVCTRVLKCHRGRVKRISLEGNSDSCFLTCAEDGTVRQHDLRIGHTCKTQCPPPLCSYREQGIGLYSLTTSVMRPDLFAVAGTSPYAFLHDRRMIPRLIQSEWGVPLSPSNILTQCVRKFGPAAPPLIPGPSFDGDDDDDEQSEHEDDPTIGPRLSRLSARRLRRNRRQRLLDMNERHVTAAKLSNVNGRELLLTYSGGPICKYDIFDDPEDAFPSVQKSRSFHANTAQRTGIDRSSALEEEQDQEQVRADNPRHKRHPAGLVLPPPKSRKANADDSGSSDSVLNSTTSRRAIAGDAPTDTPPMLMSDFVTASMTDAPSLVTDSTPQAHTTDGHESPVYTVGPTPEPVSREGPSASVGSQFLREPPDNTSQDAPRGGRQSLPAEASRTHQVAQPTSGLDTGAFEIRVGADGQLEMEIGADGSEDEFSNDNAPSLEQGVGFASIFDQLDEVENMDRDELVASGLLDEDNLDISDDGTESDDVDDSEEDDSGDEEGSEDDISDSDADMPSPQPFPSNNIPLVRPTQVYTGHRNVDTVKDVNFGGLLDDLVISGSDDGNLFIWDKQTSELLGIWKGDDSVVNVLTFHPKLPVLAVSGIDNSVKVLAPTTTSRQEDGKKYSRIKDKVEIMNRNRDSSWTSERLVMPPSRVLMRLLSRAGVFDTSGGDDEEGDAERERPRPGRRIPLQELLQLAGEEQGEEGADCIIA